jgi:predicted nucleic acid-binding protein
VTYLLAPNVISEIRRERGNPHVKSWFAGVPAGELYLSVLTVGEIRHGIERLRRRDTSQIAAFETWLRALQRDFADRLVPITAEIADAWGRLGVPDPVPTIDGLLAATAQVHGLTLVTRNTADLARTGVRLLNPFEEHG